MRVRRCVSFHLGGNAQLLWYTHGPPDAQRAYEVQQRDQGNKRTRIARIVALICWYTGGADSGCQVGVA